MAKENLLEIFIVLCYIAIGVAAILAFLFAFITKRKFEKKTHRLLTYCENLTIQNEYLQSLVDEFILPKLIIVQKEFIKDGVFKLTFKNKGGALFNLTYTRTLNSNIVINLGDFLNLAPEQTIQVDLFIKKDDLDEFITIRYNDKLKRTFTQKIVFRDIMIFIEPQRLEKHSAAKSYPYTGPKLAWKRQIANM